MIISHKYKFIFIKTVKTAGTSIEVFLSQYCGTSDIVTPITPHIEPHIARNYRGFWNPIPELIFNNARGRYRCLTELAKGNRFYNHIPAKVVRQRVSNDIWSSYFKFCVERNPFDKTLSHYHMINSRSKERLAFDDYIRRGRFCINFPKYTDHQGNLIIDKVIKYESLMEELSTIFDEVGIPFNGSLGGKAKTDYRSDRTPYKMVINNSQRKILETAFAQEIEMHGYSFL
jgi:hypothetical protein